MENSEQINDESTKVKDSFPILKFFAFKHLPSHLQEISRDFSELAHQMACKGLDNPSETAAGLRKLLEAKDCAVRAALK
jgi:ferritin-like protein